MQSIADMSVVALKYFILQYCLYSLDTAGRSDKKKKTSAYKVPAGDSLYVPRKTAKATEAQR